MKYMRRYYIRFSLAIALTAMITVYSYKAVTYASTASTIVRPISTGAVTGWTGTGTPGGSCTGLCDYIDEAATDSDVSYLNGTAGASPSAVFSIGGSATTGQTVTSVVVHVIGRAANGSILGYPPVTVSLTVGASTVSAPTITFNSTTYQDLTATFTGTWLKSDFDTASVRIVKAANGLQPAVRISTVYADVTLRSPDQNQNATRVYANTNSATPGAPLAATNTRAEVQQNAPFRLRAGIGVSDYNWTTGNWGPHGNTYNLQYAQKTAATCSVQSTGWANVASGSGAIRWFDNASVTDGTAISSYAQDPTTSGSKVYQTYRESNNFTNTTTTASGSTALWDFSLTNASSVTPGTSFCLRIYKSDGTALTSYSAYPEILIVKDYSVGIIDNGGSDVVSPFVSFPTGTVATTQCATSSATLGVSSQKLRINNDLVANGWNVTIAATGGPTSLWTSGASHYDFNDSSGSPGGCGDGGDSDAYGGQLRVNPTVGSVTSEAGCTTTGLSWGPDTKFSQNVADAITIGSANATAERFCYWDVTGVALEQRIPPQTPAGSYSMDMTITMTAL